MVWEDNIPHLLDETLEQIKSELGRAVDEDLQSILLKNVRRCRLHQYLRLYPEGTIKTYISHVSHGYEVNHYYLEQVQQQKKSEVWEPLLGKIRQWSYRFLGRWKLDESTRMTYTGEVAQETSLAIMHAYYPYDCEFDAWACKVTHHVCSKYMKRHDLSSEIDNLNLLELDEWYEGLGKGSTTSLEGRLATEQLLLDAITQLSEEKKSVIWYFYYEDWTLQQIATDMDVSANTVYKRHFDALKQLRKILDNT